MKLYNIPVMLGLVIADVLPESAPAVLSDDCQNFHRHETCSDETALYSFIFSVL